MSEPKSVISDGSHTELGYVLLEHASVRLLPSQDCAGGSKSSIQTNVWYNVKLCSGKEDEGLPTKIPDDSCTRCEVFMRPIPQDECLGILWDSILPLSPPLASKSWKRCACREKSDAAIALGLLKSLQGDVHVKECRALFLDESFRNVAMVISLSFPLCSATKTGGRSLVGTRTFKPLSNDWQLLLTTIRSNWDQLEKLMKSLEDPKVSQSRGQRRRSTLFPPRLSMEELYQRIQGSTFDEEQRRLSLDQRLLTQAGGLVKLPPDLLVTRIAPFLAATALDGLRATCTYFHGLLEGVVPGLKLQLYRHQISSLTWMRERERHALLESDCLAAGPFRSPDGDLHRAVTGGQTVRLIPRGEPEERAFRVDTFTGREIQVLNATGASPRRRVCRGGLLVDEPGLGKTITVLSLILQTAGLTTNPLQSIDGDRDQEVEVSDATLFQTYWRESVPADFQRQDLLRITNHITKQVVRGRVLLMHIYKRIAGSAYSADFNLFVEDAENALSEHYLSTPSEDTILPPLVLLLRELVEEYKDRMLASAKKSFSNPKAKPNSNLAALIDEAKRLRFIKSLIPSRGTLIVIPSVLMDHWEAQINMHIDTTYLSRKLPSLVYAFGGDGISLTSASKLIELGKFEPLVFLDRGGTKALPKAEFLAKFLIVITTTSRFSQEWKNGSFQEEIERNLDGASERIFERSLDRSMASVCSLLKIHWIRTVHDEGHSMGRAALGSSIQFASWISSERRWAMTGTPTKEGPYALSQVRNLMRFLQHDFFTPRGDGEMVWTKYIARLWKEGKEAGNRRHLANGDTNFDDTVLSSGGLAAFFRLRALLGLLMKRHTKEDIVELSPPIYKESLVSMSFAEVTTYNSLVTAIQANLLLTSMKDDAQQDSLLHRSQQRHARQALSNVRSVCVGFSRVVPTLTEKTWRETIDLIQAYGISSEREARIRHFMHGAETERLTFCDCCGFELSTLLILPCCGGLMCTECMDGQSTMQSTPVGLKNADVKPKTKRKNRNFFKKHCILCEDAFDVDFLQLLQPGFVLTWRDNLTMGTTKAMTNGDVPARTEAHNGSVRIPHQEANLSAGDGLAGMAILVRPIEPRRRTRKPNDGHECEYDRFSVDGTCVLCLKEHDSCNLLSTGRCDVCHRTARDCPSEETKSWFLVNKCLSLMQGSAPVHNDLEQDRGSRPIKIIIFSQFRKALNLVGDRLLGRFGTACVSEYWGAYRTQELKKFTQDPECFCMLLGKDGSEGLDLSFVTHIFFLEEIWDKSLAAQTVARAWRMGARGAVEVETILAKESVEETMKAFEAGLLNEQDVSQSETPSLFKPKDYQQRKAHVLLQSLRFITDYHSFGTKPSTDDIKMAAKRSGLGPVVMPPLPKRRKITFADQA